MAAKPTTYRPKDSKSEADKSFGHTLMFLNDGVTHADLSTEMHRMGKELKDIASMAGKAKGSINLKMSFEADSKSVAIVVTFTKTMPKAPTPATRMWFTPDGNIVPDNPKQPDLPGLRAIADEDEELRGVPEDEESNPRAIP